MEACRARRRASTRASTTADRPARPRGPAAGSAPGGRARRTHGGPRAPQPSCLRSPPPTSPPTGWFRVRFHGPHSALQNETKERKKKMSEKSAAKKRMSCNFPRDGADGVCSLPRAPAGHSAEGTRRWRAEAGGPGRTPSEPVSPPRRTRIERPRLRTGRAGPRHSCPQPGANLDVPSKLARTSVP